MERVEYLVRYENENTNLDFKSIQYDKPKFEALLKDVISMANAVGNDDRYIIAGVNYSSNGDRNVIGVEPGSFMDSAVYQQLVYENIEPHIDFEYYPFEVDAHLVGVIRLSNCTNRPYMMKKDYGSLKKGDAFIRRGDSQDRLIRRDIDLILEERAADLDFSQHLDIGFDTDATPSRVALPVLSFFEFPSKRAEKRIRRILEKKREEARRMEETEQDETKVLPPGLQGLAGQLQSIQFVSGAVDFRKAFYPFGGVPYEQRTIEELEEALEKVNEWYFEEDMHELYEVQSHRLNLRIVNRAGGYLEDASLTMTFPRVDGLLVADRVFSKPKKQSGLLPKPSAPYLFPTGYPEVKETDDEITATSRLGDVRHHMPETVFGKSLRVVFAPNLAGSELKVAVRVFGKNLRMPIDRELTIEIVGSD